MENLVGLKFNRLTVLAFADKTKNGVPRWLCICSCGNKTKPIAGADLKRGHAKSCGCVHRLRASQTNKTHGLSKTPEYWSWTNMTQRCYNKNHPRYADYGGRGITICKRWLNSFEAFLADMGPKPTPKHTIERKNNNGTYCKSNCIWATKAEQNQNTRVVLRLTFNGETHTVLQWSQITGISPKNIKARLRLGWSIPDAITTPANRSNKYVKIKRGSRHHSGQGPKE